MLTLGLIASASWALRFIQNKELQVSVSMTMSEQRQRKVIARNLVIMVAMIVVVSLWATRIAGFALSLAAVAGALLIVSKEAITNLLGFAMMSVLKPYKIGDFIEVSGYKGRVVDIHAMGTTLLEMREGNQITGQSVLLPNSMLLTQVVRNLSDTGDFCLYLLPIAIPYHETVGLHEEALLIAANTVVAPWRSMADDHFKRIESQRHVALPSAECRVIIEIKDEKCYTLSLRYACTPNNRVKVEQEILRIYLKERPVQHKAIKY